MSDLLDLVNTGKRASPTELVGSALTKSLLLERESDDKLILCAVSDLDDEDAISELFVTYIRTANHKYFVSDFGITWLHAIAIDPKGKPLTSDELRSAM